MAYCYNCGNDVPDGVDICLNCGSALNKDKQKSAGDSTAGQGGKPAQKRQARQPTVNKTSQKKIADKATDITKIAGSAPHDASDQDKSQQAETPKFSNDEKLKKPKRAGRNRVTTLLRTPGFRLFAGVVLLVPGLVLPWFSFESGRSVEVFSIPFIFIFADKLDLLPQLSTGIVLSAVFAFSFFFALSQRGIGVFLLQLLAFFSVVISIGALLMGFRFVNAMIELGPGYETYVQERTALMPEINIFRITPPEPAASKNTAPPVSKQKMSALRSLIKVLGAGMLFPFLSGVIILWSSMAYAPVADRQGFRLTPVYAAIAALLLVVPGFLFLFPRVSPAAWYNFQAAMLLRVNRVGQAEKKLEACVALPAPHSTCEVGLARIYWQTGRVKKAMPLYQKITKEQPGIPETHRDLGEMYFKGKNYWKAAEEYRKYLKLKPGNSKYKEKLSVSLILIGNQNYATGKLKTALRLYKEANELIPSNKNDIALQYKIGDIYYQLGKKANALEHFKITADLQPDDFEQQDLVAKVYEEIGDYENAIIYYKKSIAIKPDNTMSYVHIGDIYKNRLHDRDSGIKWYKDAIKTDLYSHGADLARKRLRALGIEYIR